MTTKGLIDAIIAYEDNVDPSDADNAGHRLRILQYCQEVFNYVWYHQPWTFKQRSANIVATASNGYANVPADFENLGFDGGVFDTQSGRRLREVTYNELQTHKRNLAGASAGDNPFVFAIGGFDTTSNLKRINILNNSGSVNLTVDYDCLPGTLVDSDTTSKLETIPVAYHHTVLVPGVRAWTMKNLGAKEDWLTPFIKGLAYMTAREIPLKSQVAQMPRANLGMY